MSLEGRLALRGKLVSFQEAGLEDGVGCEQQWVLHQVKNPANTFLAKAAHKLVKPHLFTGDAKYLEPAFRQSEPAGRFDVPEGRQLHITEEGRGVKHAGSFLTLRTMSETDECIFRNNPK